jgi:sulfatase maturation enzyme AslB (radical SAM superfamily)
MKNQYAQYAKWFINPAETVIPASVDIDLTNVCNQDCYYCNSAEFRSQVPVQKKYTDYITLLDQLKSWADRPNTLGTLNTVTYPGGGEPTVLPGYEHVLEHTVDLNFMTAITTNGSRLDRLIENVTVDKIRKISWFGIDFDAGNKETYEKIRRSLTKESLFDRVVSNATALVRLGARVDFKVLLGEFNSSTAEIQSIFELARNIGVRQVYFRPTILDNTAFNIDNNIVTAVKQASYQYSMPYKLNLTKSEPRTYKRCHAMYMFPVFCADGGVYSCCDNKGNPAFKITDWDQGDWREQWQGARHREIYEKTLVEFCKPCRPNTHNNNVQSLINDTDKLEDLFW